MTKIVIRLPCFICSWLLLSINDFAVNNFMKIDVDKPFTLFANCSIIYDGRASSTCKKGNYLIIRKGDGTLMIHGNSLTKPLNYQPPTAIMVQKENKLLSTYKHETIQIDIKEFIHYQALTNWHDNKISISKTEDELRQKFINNIHSYFETYDEIYTEYKTPLGPVDLLVVINNVYHVFEFKRKRTGIQTIGQITRYMSYFKEIGKEHIGYIAAPGMSDNAMNQANKKGIKFIQIDFDLPTS